MKQYNFKEVEEKWQKRWYEEKSFKAVDFHPTKPKFYILYEFYFISGKLHMGHLKGTVPGDTLARYKRLKGFNVLFPIGGDSFGLPAENAAIKNKINPQDFVESGAKVAFEQSRKIGLSFDWDRTFCTSDPDYYKWTQWIFLQLLKEGKAYKKKGIVNFCPTCQTVLSNEDSQGGKCDRCHGDVIQKERWVWFLKMSEYSEKLLGNVDRITMAENLKEAQRNWIGKSEGMQVAFPLCNESGEQIENAEIYTTCIETIYGVTFLVMAPEHELVKKLSPYIKNMDKVNEYIKETSLRSELDRISDQKSKTGCELEGIYAINPVNGNKVKVYLADFVLAHYGTGAVMAVPSHDQRDFDFAKAFNIPMIQVIEGDCEKQAVEKQEYLAKNSKMLNSEEFNGLTVKEAKEKIADKIEKDGKGKKTVNYKMQDWSFNRQRFWGEPFPVVFCDKCGCVALNEEDLPLTLPETQDYTPNENGDSPLSKIDAWCNTTCPKCGGPAKRETDTMPNWAGSSWYWLRYIDPHNDKALADFEKLKYWGSVDVYTGGTEHITRHVLYAFFWQNFLYEIGAVPTRDPFIRKMGSGLVLDSEGKKMSKSSSNGVSPMEVIEQYGADATRMHLHFLGGYEDNTPWTYNGITGITSFLDKVWRFQEIIKEGNVSKEHIVPLNKLIKKLSDDYENLRLNTAIASLMEFSNIIKQDKFITKEEYRQFLILLNPLAPHITSEIYEIIFGKNLIDDKWPEYDEKYLEASEIELPIQINGKMKKTVMIPKDAKEDEILSIIKETYPGLIDFEPKKVIYVKARIINIIK